MHERIVKQGGKDLTQRAVAAAIEVGTALEAFAAFRAEVAKVFRQVYGHQDYPGLLAIS